MYAKELCETRVAPQQEGEVHGLLLQLDQSLEALMDSVNTMQYRLEPVLRQSEPQVAGKDGVQRCPSTQVGERLLLQINRVSHATDVLREALNRLEV